MTKLVRAKIMAAEILEALLRTNLAAALGVLLVLVLRRSVRAACGASAAYALWAAAPIAAFASLMPALDASPFTASVPAEVFGATFLVRAVQGADPGVAPAALVIWLFGLAVGLAVLTVRQVRFSRALGRLRLSQSEPSVAYAARPSVGPAVVGFVWPKIVLPSDFHDRYTCCEQEMILAHERSHLRAGDTRINALVALLQCACWFNPLVHLGAAMARQDQEFARDAAVASRFPEARRSYAEAMLKAQLAASPVALGCSWTPRTARVLKKRIAMLAKPSPNRARRAVGGTFAACACALAAAAAWTLQPATPAFAQSQQAEGAALDDSDGLRPRAAVSPTYPPAAANAGQTGECTVSFDIMDDGGTSDVSAECSLPVFVASAEDAVSRWRYPSRAEDDSGEPRSDVETVIMFELAAE